MSEIDYKEAGRQLPALIKRVQAGEAIVITKDGTPAARLVPAEPANALTDEDRQRAITEMLAFGRGRKLPEGMTVRDLINEGRRY